MGIIACFARNNLVQKMYSEYMYWKFKHLFEKDPKLSANYAYKRVFGHDIDWNNPQDLNEKIRWMLIYTDTSLWTKCADKFAVREYVKEKACGQYLVDLYGKWADPQTIDFAELPQSFVLKANNGCGTVMVIQDKSEINETKVKKELTSWLQRPFGYSSGQLHYLPIPRCIIAERLLEEEGETKQLSPTSLVDYKIWCINGQPECILVIFGRKNGQYCRQVYDTNWKKKSDVINKKADAHTEYVDIDIPKPLCLNEMLAMAKRLSEPFPEVRVDLYVVGGRPYFGELTFTAGMKSFTPEYYKYLGDKIDISQLPRK